MHPTRMTGMVGPQIDRTSSIHCAHAVRGVSRKLSGRRAHLNRYVVERVWGVDGEGDEDYMRLGVRHWPETFVLFLASVKRVESVSIRDRRSSSVRVRAVSAAVARARAWRSRREAGAKCTRRNESGVRNTSDNENACAAR